MNIYMYAAENMRARIEKHWISTEKSAGYGKVNNDGKKKSTLDNVIDEPLLISNALKILEYTVDITREKHIIPTKWRKVVLKRQINRNYS